MSKPTREKRKQLNKDDFEEVRFWKSVALSLTLFSASLFITLLLVLLAK